MSAVVVPFPVRDDDRQEPLCATRDPAWWFEPELFQRAIEVCGRCPMRSGCLANALQSGERLGVWGGLTPEQRAALPVADVIVLRPAGGRR
jgi:hypothetical protein